MRAGAAGDEHVRVGGAEPGSVGEASLERGEADWVERHRVRSVPEPHLPRCGVDVGDGERSQLADRRTVQQREQSDERLVRVAVSAGPAAQQLCLVAAGEGLAAVPAGGLVREACGRVGEADPLLRVKRKKSRSAASRNPRSRPVARNALMREREQVAQSRTPCWSRCMANWARTARRCSIV